MHRLEDLEIYQLSMRIGDIVWETVMKWDSFSKFSMGTQIIKCVDSISANIAEGYGRNSNKEVKQFCFYSRGSLKETICFLQKSKTRNLISEDSFLLIMKDVDLLGKKLNNYIKYLN